MNSLLHADIFFLVATIGLAIIFLLVAIALVYVIVLFRRIARVSARIERDIDSIGDTAKDFIMQLWDSPIFSWIFGAKKKKRKPMA